MTDLRPAISAIGLAALLVGCGGGAGASSSSNYDSPKALADAMGCGDSFTAGAADDETFTFPGAPKADQQGNCTYEGNDLELVVVDDHGALRNLEKMATTLGCSMGEAFGVDNFQYVRGDNWYINADSKKQATALVASFEGEVVDHTC